MSPRDWWSLRLLYAANVFPNSTPMEQRLRRKLTSMQHVCAWYWRHATSRLLMGEFRYEAKDTDGHSYDERARAGHAKTYGQRMADKLAIYNQTGNQEMLIDVFNYCLLEVAQPTHPTPHFISTERYDHE